MVYRTVGIVALVVATLVTSGGRRTDAAPVYDQVGGTWLDDYADTAGLSSKNQVDVDPTDGSLKLTNSSGGFTPPFNTSGSLITTTIIPTSVAQWGSVVLTQQTPVGTSLTVQILDEGNALYQDNRLPGNTLGFPGPSVDLNDLQVDRTAGNNNAKFARVRVKITLSTSDVAQTPAVDSVILTWTVTQGDLSASPLANTSWPSSNGDAQATRNTAAIANPPYLAVRWARPQSGDYGGALTRGFGETIFNKTFGGASNVQEKLAALDRRTGELIWERQLFGWNYSSETAHTLSQNGSLYLSDLFSDVLLAYDTTNNGSLKWTYQFLGGHGNAKVSIGSDGSVYTLRTLTGYAFHPDGSVKWTRALPSGHPDPGYSQVVIGTNGELYFAAQTTSGGDGALYALDPTTGADIWSPLPIGSYVNLAPLVDSAGDIYIANDSNSVADKKIFAVHPNGTPKWERSIGSTSEHWTALALRSDGTLLAERVRAYNTGTAGSIEALDLATGALLWSVPVISDNGAFLSDLFVDGSDGFYAKRTLVRIETDIYYVDSARNQKWRLRHNPGGAIANFHDLIQDEDGSVYGNLYSSSFGNTVIGLSPWKMDACVQPCNVSPGNQLTIAITTPLPSTDPLSGQPNKVQALLDNGVKVPLQYQYDVDGAAVWIGRYTVAAGTAVGTHNFTVEANAAGIATDVPVHFAAPATDSSNSGVTTAARFGVETNPCITDEVCTSTVLRCGNGVPDSGELCDDGNFTDGDGCDSNCTLTGCGNGIRTSGEGCDDGNLARGDGCAATCQPETMLDDAAQKCVNGANKKGTAVAAAQGKLNQSCLKAAAAGSVSMSTCIVDDVGLKVQKPETKVTDTVASLCVSPPSFAFTDAPAVNTAARTAGREVAHDLFGAGLAVISATADPAGSACQTAILKASLKILGTKAKAFLKCKKEGLAAKLLPRIISAADLLRCFDNVEAGTADAVATLTATAAKKCSGVTLGTAFPPASAAADFATFVHARLECRTCLMFNAMDGLSENCDLFDDATANSSCS